jgi:hypothetical protein
MHGPSKRALSWRRIKIMDSSDLKAGYEVVFTVTDYHDGPRRGIANYQGRPHFYDCIFDEAKDDYSDLFWLTPIDQATFELAMEAWALWRKWEMAYHTGKTSLATHPALPEDASRTAELQRMLERLLVTDRQVAFTSNGKLEALGKQDLPKSVMRSLQVKWAKRTSPEAHRS